MLRRKSRKKKFGSFLTILLIWWIFSVVIADNVYARIQADLDFIAVTLWIGVSAWLFVTFQESSAEQSQVSKAPGCNQSSQAVAETESDANNVSQ